MKEKLIRWMQGRYGHDSLNYFLMVMYFVMLILSIPFKNNVLSLLGCFCLFFACFRCFSRHYQARYHENQLFLKYTRPIRQRWKAFRKNRADHDKKYFVCPGCGQLVRVPRKRGKIDITCPTCHKTFSRRS